MGYLLASDRRLLKQIRKDSPDSYDEFPDIMLDEDEEVIEYA